MISGSIIEKKYNSIKSFTSVSYSRSSCLDLTIAIPVKNEEINLPKCLEAIGEGFAKKIHIIDSGSTDKTKSIAQSFGAEVINFDWNGQFPKKRNWYLRNNMVNTKWILFLDADEYITDEFKNELRESLPTSNKSGYWLNYTIFFMGKQLRGGYPLKKLALFRVGSGEYERIDENNWSHLDMEVHEHPVLNGETSSLKSKILHQDFRNISHYLNKHNEYASWEFARYLKAKKDGALKGSQWTWKQRIKYRFLKSIWVGPFYFLASFILFGGFRDGRRGLAFAIFKMAYFTQVSCKIRESKVKFKAGQNERFNDQNQPLMLNQPL